MTMTHRSKKSNTEQANKEPLMVGWLEWVALPELGINAIKAKVDTGARTSCLHAFDVEEFEKAGEPWIKFWIYPIEDNATTKVICQARVIDKRKVKDSGGHETERYVIETKMNIGKQSYSIELTLNARDNMRYRMLLGRIAMEGRLIVNPAASYLVPLSKGL